MESCKCITTSDRISALLNLEEIVEKNEFVDCLNKLAEGEVLISAEHKINLAKHLFSRIDDKKIEAQIEKLKASDQKEEVHIREEKAVVQQRLRISRQYEHDCIIAFAIKWGDKKD